MQNAERTVAEHATLAFGRYLNVLRERRGLSLADVCALSAAFAEQLNRGYLSRCENGHQKLAFCKVLPLSRIYDVPADVLLDRMELDLELDRIGGPDTATPTFSDLSVLWKQSIDQGYRWTAYAYARDAISSALQAPLVDLYRSPEEQYTCAQMNTGTSALGLGKVRFALHEFEVLRRTGYCRPRYSALILERISVCHRRMGDANKARELAELAIAETEESGDLKYLGYLLECRANIAHKEHDLDAAARYFRHAFKAHQSQDQQAECAITLNNLAQCYFEARRYSSARRSLQASLKISRALGQQHVQALTQILLGEIDARQRHHERATARFRSAAEIARKLHNKTLRFQAEFPLYRLARDIGDERTARCLARRLRLLAPSIPPHVAELQMFRQDAIEA